MPFRTAAQHVLEEWREAERRRDAAAGTPEAEHWDAEMTRLRAAYAEVIKAARIAHMPEPDAWPGDRVADVLPSGLADELLGRAAENASG